MRARQLVASVALVAAGFGAGAITSSSADDSYPTTRCGVWKDSQVQQCNLYYGDVRHVRTSVYVNGEWFMTDDMWPQNFARNASGAGGIAAPPQASTRTPKRALPHL